HRRDDRAIGFDHGREVAAAITGAELMVLEGAEHLPWMGDATAVLAALGIAPDARRRDPAEEADAELRRAGDVWTGGFAGLPVHAKHALGLRDLAPLVAPPGRRFEAMELLVGPSVEPASPSGADPVLDETARTQFRTRLATIDASLAELGSGD